MSVKNPSSRDVFWEFDYRKIIFTINGRWMGIGLTLLFAWGLAWLYLHYTPAVYTTSAALKFETSRSEIAELIQVKNRFYPPDKAHSEKFIIQSHRVRMAAAKSLNQPVSFYKSNLLHLTDLYPKKPLEITIIEKLPHFFKGLLDFETIDRNGYRLSIKLDGSTFQKHIKYGAIVSLPGIKFKVRCTNYLPLRICFRFNTEDAIAELIGKGLRLEETELDGILHLKLTDANTYFAADALNHLTQAYLAYNTAQRSTSASQTVRFIDTLLYNMQKEVSHTGKAVEDFKVKNRFLDLSVHAEQQVNKLSNLESEKKLLAMELVNLRSIEKNISFSETAEQFNFNIQGNTDPMLATLVQRFNQLLLQKKEKGLAYKPESLAMKNVDEQLTDIKLTIVQNLRMQIDKKLKSATDADQQISHLKASYQYLPIAERNFINLKSAFDVNQKIFNYLSEKKLEAQISRAAATPSAVIVDHARPSFEIVSPHPGKVFTTATLGGCVASFLFILLSKTLRPYINDRETLEQLTDIPIIGTVSSYIPDITNDPFKIVTVTHPSIPFAETIRSIRTHLAFLAVEEPSKIVCVTSEISGEGKSLISVNLAGALAMLGQKVIMITTDLRKPQTQQFFETDNPRGLSDYLAGRAIKEDVIFASQVSNLWFIPAGSVPPNPGELLFGVRMMELLQKLKEEYAFIILDTAPAGLVSDPLPLMKNSDINLFVIRAGFSRYESAGLPGKLKESCALNNLYLILNDLKPDFLYNSYYRGGYDGKI